jgi:histidyl-tRNA synthetase
VVLVALEFLKRILEEDYIIKINNRKVLRGLTEKADVPESLAHECFRAIDKLDKIGKDGVMEELRERGIAEESSRFLIDAIDMSGTGMSVLDRFQDVLEGSDIGQKGVDELRFMAQVFDECKKSKYVEFDMSLARGLDYYTGPVFEGRYLGEPDVGSVLGGGRYDNLIEKFKGPPTPATGISLGIGRLIDVMLEKGLGEDLAPELDAFIAPIKKPMVKHAMRMQCDLVAAGISCEVDLMDRSLGKLLELADSRNARYTIIVGKRDLSRGEVSLRDMLTKETEQVKVGNIVERVLRFTEQAGPPC